MAKPVFTVMNFSIHEPEAPGTGGPEGGGDAEGVLQLGVVEGAAVGALPVRPLVLPPHRLGHLAAAAPQLDGGVGGGVGRRHARGGGRDQHRPEHWPW